MIEFDNVSFSYPGQREGGLDRINLTVGAGECVLLCGRSGCGKTTLTRLVNGVIPGFYRGEFSGSVRIDGREVFKTPMFELAKRVGSVFQNPRTQFFSVDTDSEIVFGLENEGLARPELRERLERTSRDLQLAPLRGRSIFELSGGEKQKIAFASVYAMNPDVFVLDEPSSNLDLRSIYELRERLRRVKAQGKTILIAEHRLFYLLDLADRIVYLDQGKIRSIFSPSAFRALSAEARAEKGLRAVDLSEEGPAAVPQDTGTGAGEKAALTLRGVGVSFQDRPLLDRINAEVGRGEIVAICGENGAGKTTFSRCLCGLSPIRAERDDGIFREGRRADERERLKRSFFVMQDVNYELFAESVEAECSFGIRNADAAEVALTLEKLGLASFKDRHPNTLSGGQKQRLAVAVSRISRKELLVFDEPTAGLDYDGMRRVSALIRELAGEGKIVFVVTHDYELICHACTRVFHFQSGTLAADLPVTPGTAAPIRALLGIERGE